MLAIPRQNIRKNIYKIARPEYAKGNVDIFQTDTRIKTTNINQSLSPEHLGRNHRARFTIKEEIIKI